jgi:hypothetical protein
MTKVKVIVYDQLPGTGKSTRMINKINNSDKDQRFIVVTPFLAECHRYAGTVKDEDSGDKQLPLKDTQGNIVYDGTGCSASGRRFEHPVSGYRTKVEHIAKLVHEGKDIVTTHAALKLFTPETVKDVKDAGYTLVIDEELECIRPHPCKMHRRKMLLGSGAVYEDTLGLLRWNEDYDTSDDTKDVDSSGFSWDMQIKALCDNGSLVLIADEKGNRDLFMWEYPIEFIKAFDKVEVLTYLFKGSVFEKYLDFYGIQHETQIGIQLPSNVFDLINIVDNPKMNRVGEREQALSVTSQKTYTKDSAVAKVVRANLNNFFRNSTYGKSGTDDRLWTCLGEAFSVFKGAGYTKCHIAHNTKAVNDYMNTSQLAYVFNANLHPEPYKYLLKRGDQFAPDLDRYALSELLQWVYRSRVRNDEPINLYVPSSRMRGLLEGWMSGNMV